MSVDETGPHSTDENYEPSKGKEKKSRKDKKKKVEPEQEESHPSAKRKHSPKPDKAEKSKKKKESKEGQVLEEKITEDSEKKKKKKSKKGEDQGKVVEVAEEEVEETTQKSKKKRKREIIEDTSPDTPEPPKKKKSKNKTGFPDPEEDSTLSEQARKALSYAFVQFRKPKKWKFHKARQNWLIRNYWSTEAIPDAQLPLVLKYLSNVQGGVRENLLKTCNSIIEAERPTTDATTPEQQSDEKPKQELDELKRKRARELLAVLQVPSA